MLLRLVPVLACLGSAATAEGLKIVTDIAPVHSLVSMIAAEDDEVVMLLAPGTSPHGYALRPSDAAALQDADLVVWVGEDLTPWLAETLETLSPNAETVALMDIDAVQLLPYRDVAVFGGKGAHDDHDDHDGHGHGAHDDHDHAKTAAAEHDHDHDAHEGHDHDDHAKDGHSDAHNDHAHDHAHGHAHDHGHDHGHGHGHDHGDGSDPHAWLDPANAEQLILATAETLSGLRPDRAEAYTSAAAQAQEQIGSLTASISEALVPYGDAPFLVYHDAYQYFETRFGLNVAGAIAASDADQPGPQRLAALRDAVADQNITCAFYEPQFSPRLIAAVGEGARLQQAELDPLGSALTPGPELYGQLLTAMATAISDCLSSSD